MALSNIFREPRREITETAVGLLTAGIICIPIAWLDYQIAVLLDRASGSGANHIPIPAGMIIGLLFIMAGGAVLALLLVIVHAMGERVCNALDRRGVYLRPMQRYQRRW